MSRPTRPRRGRQTGLALAVACASVAAPASAHAEPVDLKTAGPFVVLAHDTVTNSGPSFLGGNLGLAPGTAITGFGFPAVVDGDTHVNDDVARQAQADLTNAYGVAASQPVSPGNVLTGQDLGNRTLSPGAYEYASSAQLTGALTLDAHGDPDAQFVFKIGSTLTTASASSVVMRNGASPCNVFWQIGSSATLGSTSAFQGNLLAYETITLDPGASVVGRALADNGEITLLDNRLDNSLCTGDTDTPPSQTGATDETDPTAEGGPARPDPLGGPLGLPVGQSLGRNGTAVLRRVPPRSRTPRTPRQLRARCAEGFRVSVRGKRIKRVVFSLDNRRIGSQIEAPYRISLKARPGRHTVSARVTFTDLTRTKTRKLRFRTCSAAVLRPRRGPSRFTG